mmetsp:Transcript_26444/g.66271  ORF Transcript_26444/g.66271 Transcript_26444/m.66271 type:complete len:152 (-) Transcript_26444:276-731(-)
MRAGWVRASHLLLHRPRCANGGGISLAAGHVDTNAHRPQPRQQQQQQLTLVAPPHSTTLGRRSVWTGGGGLDVLDEGRRIGRHDERPAPPGICQLCHRRFCQCEDKPPCKPPYPGPEDCCQSAPQCEFCTWVVYEQQLQEYEAHVRSGGSV